MRSKILIIDDDETANELLRFFLESRGFTVCVAEDGRQGLRLAYDFHPDLVLLDVMMPGMDGFELCSRLREMSDLPVILVTAKATEEDVVQGFQAGANDYVKKPYSLNELVERIHSQLRMTEEEKPGLAYADHRLMIDLERQEVAIQGEKVSLTPTEFRLLKVLVENIDQVVSHETLLTLVWGRAYRDAIANLSLYIHYLRDKLEENPDEPKYILNQWGDGYKFVTLQQAPQA